MKIYLFLVFELMMKTVDFPFPSLFPSYSPSYFDSPTSFPTFSPSFSREPTYFPSIYPTAKPTFDPTTEPTSLSTPLGSPGFSWWYLTSSKCYLWGLEQSDSAFEALQYTFDFVTKEELTDEERDHTVVFVSFIQGRQLISSVNSIYPQKMLRRHELDSLDMKIALSDGNSGEEEELPQFDDDDGNGHFTALSVYIWCVSEEISSKVKSALQLAEEDPLWIIEPMKEKGFHSLKHAVIRSVRTIITTEGPPTLSQLSPQRITWVIFGTIVLFTIAVILLGAATTFSRKNPDLRVYVRNKTRVAWKLVGPTFSRLGTASRSMYRQLRTRGMRGVSREGAAGRGEEDYLDEMDDDFEEEDDEEVALSSSILMVSTAAVGGVEESNVSGVSSTEGKSCNNTDASDSMGPTGQVGSAPPAEVDEKVGGDLVLSHSSPLPSSASIPPSGEHPCEPVSVDSFVSNTD